MVKTTPEIEAKLGFLPELPGVYIWKDKDDKVIYVGKAVILNNRIKSYLSNSPKDPKTEQLVKHIADLDYIIANNEREAFLLESDLIKQYKPKYNIMLKDDKSYPFVKLTLAEPFPRIMVSRDPVKDGSRYFGPYTDVRNLRYVLRSFEWIFPIRTCTRKIPRDEVKFDKACINYQLGKCTAPCIGNISYEDYSKIVDNLIKIFTGRHQEILDEFRDEMNQLSEDMKFEQAAKVRDRIVAIDKIQKKQTVFYPDQRTIDIIGFYLEENTAIAIILKMINGKILNQENYPLANVDNATKDDILGSFIKLYYADKDTLPDEILVPFVPVEYEELNAWLQNKITIPQKGDKTKLMAMAKLNAFHLVEEKKLSHLRKSSRTIFPIQELKEKINLPKLPRKIVCMDISTIQGTDTVSSAVFFENGKPKKKFYRHFIIQSIDTQNDFAAMIETMQRFLKEVAKDPEMKPDLFLIDGGKGQLSSAYGELSRSEFPEIPIVSVAKRIEELFIPNREDSLILARSSSALRLITTIRDEAHRFAINFHRSRRKKRTLVSELETIVGIGEQTKFVLLKAFGSVEAIRNASIEQLSSVKTIGEKTAQTIYAYFHEPEIDD
ncbi:MAG: excinuclease ABC subunit UvrC [Candidatus Cloacimonetes bacterium HGW-Cloacimonetes-1]|nr:MAG: excinuclease ABC subunit UvrC [Candidatus Cloacimonetes bacterium HGW-Cloacimonetes-1]